MKGFFVAIILLLALTACTDQELQALRGLVQDVDSAEGKITIVMEDGTTRVLEFQVSTPVEDAEGASSTQPLEVGEEIEIEVDDDTNTVERIKKAHAEVEGVVQAADGNSGTVTILSERGREVTLQVAEETRIELEEDFPGTFADLQVGTQVEAKFNPDTMVAIKIEIEDEEEEVEGVIQSLEPFIIVTDSGRELELQVEATTQIEVEDFKGASLTDLVVGDEVKVKFDPNTRLALRIRVED